MVYSKNPSWRNSGFCCHRYLKMKGAHQSLMRSMLSILLLELRYLHFSSLWQAFMKTYQINQPTLYFFSFQVLCNLDTGGTVIPEGLGCENDFLHVTIIWQFGTWNLINAFQSKCCTSRCLDSICSAIPPILLFFNISESSIRTRQC